MICENEKGERLSSAVFEKKGQQGEEGNSLKVRCGETAHLEITEPDLRVDNGECQDMINERLRSP